MKRFRSIRMWLRLILALSITGLVISGVAYAALQSQQTSLTGNTIESATAALQLSKDGATYLGNATGFDFNGLIPGGPAMPSQFGGYPLWLKNSGSAPLTYNVAIATTPTTTGDVDLSKVFVVLTPITGGGTSQSLSVASLVATKTTGGVPLTIPTQAAGASMQYKVQVQMAADAFSGSTATISNLDLVFGGTAATS